MSITPYQFFKNIFSIYIALIWLSLIPVQKYLISSLNKISNTPSSYWSWIDQHGLTSAVLVSLSIFSLLINVPRLTRWVSGIVLIHWILLFSFFPVFYGPPNGAYTGWLLIWLCLFPNLKELKFNHQMIWWWVLCLGYFCGGLGKYYSHPWIAGTAVDYLAQSALTVKHAKLIIEYPILSKFLNYSALALEIGAIFLIFNFYSRKFLWWSILLMNLIIMFGMQLPEIGLFFIIFQIPLIESKVNEGPQ